jgi:hypothetical protein
MALDFLQKKIISFENKFCLIIGDTGGHFKFPSNMFEEPQFDINEYEQIKAEILKNEYINTINIDFDYLSLAILNKINRYYTDDLTADISENARDVVELNRFVRGVIQFFIRELKELNSKLKIIFIAESSAKISEYESVFYVFRTFKEFAEQGEFVIKFVKN